MWQERGGGEGWGEGEGEGGGCALSSFLEEGATLQKEMAKHIYLSAAGWPHTYQHLDLNHVDGTHARYLPTLFRPARTCRLSRRALCAGKRFLAP